MRPPIEYRTTMTGETERDGQGDYDGQSEYEVEGEYDLVVVGGTPGGIATAVRAAREDLETLLVTVNAHLGGMMAGGLSLTDTTIWRDRAPLLDEFFERVRERYRREYGEDSEQYEHCREGRFFEPKVAESVFDELIGEEPTLAAERRYYPVAAEQSGSTLRAVRFEAFDEGEGFTASSAAFADATYEGDLAAVAGVPYRLGRESREEFDEQYAGVLFSEKGTRLFTGSTGEGDEAIQAYDYRLCLTNDPENRRLPERPDDYDREEFLPIVEDPPDAEYDANDPLDSELLECRIKSELVRPTVEEIRARGLESVLMLRGPLPNRKRDLNTADLPGEADDYPEADWNRREDIAQRHRDHVLGMLHFLQNDEAVPEDLRETAREWGLPKDEFPDNDNFPFQLYVREARRIEGRETFTENDARQAPGLDRAPINDGSIAVAEYPMDSHDCRPVRRPASLAEGHFFLPEITVPSQVPYGTFLPEALDNLLVPVPLSATHVGFGTIRLEPTWFQLGESAGFAAALAAERGVSPADLSMEALQRRLVESGSMLTYFEDVDVGSGEPWVPAVQYLGTKGFFGTYEARPTEPLEEATADRWARTAAALVTGSGDPAATARAVHRETERQDANAGSPVTLAEFGEGLREALSRAEATADLDAAVGVLDTSDDDPLTRGDACRIVYELAN